MNANPVWMLFIHGFVTGFLTIWLGLLLVNIRPSLKKLILVGLCLALMSAVIRSLPIAMSVQFAIITLVLVIMTMLNWNLSFFKSMIPVIMGTITLGLGEAISMSAIFGLTRINAAYLNAHPLVELVMPLPQILMILCLIYVCLKKNWHIFNFRNWSEFIPNERRVRIIIILASTMLSLLMVQVVFNILFNLKHKNILFRGSTENLTNLSTIVIISAFLVMVFLIQQLFVLLGKESKYITQTAYIQTLDEMYTATQAEAHDRINHLQTLYGFIQLGDLQETQTYLEELIGEIIVTRNYLSTGHPALSALFYIKSGLATSRGIQLDIVTENRVENLDLPSHELNRILGNLLNNAFDSVAELPREFRKVFLEVTKYDKKYRFCISNYGKLEPELIKNIFNRGYTTKAGEHRGLGLYIVRQLVEKNRGQLEVKSADGLVIFTVYLPAIKTGSGVDERLVSSSGKSAGSEFDSGF